MVAAARAGGHLHRADLSGERKHGDALPAHRRETWAKTRKAVP